jgi:hypothetical protein
MLNRLSYNRFQKEGVRSNTTDYWICTQCDQIYSDQESKIISLPAIINARLIFKKKLEDEILRIQKKENLQ